MADFCSSMATLRSTEIVAREAFNQVHLGNLPPVFVEVSRGYLLSERGTGATGLWCPLIECSENVRFWHPSAACDQMMVLELTKNYYVICRLHHLVGDPLCVVAAVA